jgi:hypothetical protein
MPRKSEVKPTKKNGGARPGAGRKPGGKNQATLDKERALAEYRQKIIAHADQIFREQKAMAFGTYELFIVEHYEDHNGKVKARHVRVEDPELMANILDDPELQQGDNYVLVRKVEADKFTLDSMLDRAFGKATVVTENDHKVAGDLKTDVVINLNKPVEGTEK